VSSHGERSARLLEFGGPTYAAQAGIRLVDKPTPLYQLLVTSLLLSSRISADVAIAATRELREAGYTTARKMQATTWQQRVDALGRGHYPALRREHRNAPRRGRPICCRKFRVPGRWAPDIFLREVQAAWPWVRPDAGDRAAKAAKQFGLPSTARGLASTGGTDDLSRLTAALVRASLDKKMRDKVG